MSELDTSRFDLPEVHHKLITNCTARYLGRLAPLNLFTIAEKYKPGSPASDYETTWWEANPNLFLGAFATAAVSAYLRVRPRTLNRTFSQAFEKQLDSKLPLTDVLMEKPTAIICDHQIDFEALSVINGVSDAVACSRPGNYRRERRDITRAIHIINHRGFLPLRIGHEWSPHNPKRLTYLNFIESIGNPHFTLTGSAYEAGIDPDFIASYNFQAIKDCLSAVNGGTDHPAGYEQLWVIEPEGGPNEVVKNHPKVKKVSREIGEGTKKLVKMMKFDLLPLYASICKGNIVVKTGQIIPHNEVTNSTLPDIASQQAWFRRQHGEEGVYYAEDDEVTKISN